MPSSKLPGINVAGEQIALAICCHQRHGGRRSREWSIAEGDTGIARPDCIGNALLNLCLSLWRSPYVRLSCAFQSSISPASVGIPSAPRPPVNTDHPYAVASQRVCGRCSALRRSGGGKPACSILLINCKGIWPASSAATTMMMTMGPRFHTSA